MNRIVVVLLLLTTLFGCSSGETLEEKLSKATTPAEVVEAVTSIVPTDAYVTSSTSYMHIAFERESVSKDYPLLQAKSLMPILLERYPDTERFFIGWKKDGRFFLKTEFERSKVQGIRWEILNVKKGEVQAAASTYWAAPAIR